jgi:RNA polymerase sigma factor (sigma-70 family)
MRVSGPKTEPSQGTGTLATFEDLLLPHLNAAYNLARWLTRNDQNAEDLVQDAYLRAWKSFEGFNGGDEKAWLLMIVRNTCYTWIQRNRTSELMTSFDEELHSISNHASNPEALVLQSVDKQLLQNALQELPVEFREVMVMREIEGLSYLEIAGIAGVPVGTVMSRLARARARLQEVLARPLELAAPKRTRSVNTS